METEIQAGLCDNASRMLAFLLQQDGISSKQWDMLTVKGGHAARVVSLSNGKKVFVDPFYGVVAVSPDGHLTGLKDVQARVRAGEDVHKLLLPLSDNTYWAFYDRLKDTYMGQAGDDFIIAMTLPHLNEEMIWGELNNDAVDVRKDSTRANMSASWNYMGHRFNRAWVRRLTVTQPMKIVMTLTQPAEEGVMIASPVPQVSGKTLTWLLDAGETLTLRDGDAKISLKRMNSFIPVDQLSFIPQ